jgi:hypothetical protein
MIHTDCPSTRWKNRYGELSRIFFTEERIGLGKHGAQPMSLARGDFLLSAGEKEQELPLVLTPFVGIHAEHHGRRTSPLGDDERSLARTDAPQDRRSVLP